MIGSRLAQYQVLAKLGAGGMGEVYLARDTKLDRRVALKILPADVASSPDRMERFVREAKAAAALNHPNIAHIYEIGDSEGTHFIAMEYVDGVTLREKIHHAGEPLPALLGYLGQVAEGLAKAHHAGIVHRDLKPDNVMITRDGYAKILDFGLAKLVESTAPFGIDQSGSNSTVVTVQQSMPGTVLGTIGYMSPEQASGRVNEIDHRSDIFSLGCLLFEAATGQKAFEGKDALDSLHKIVHGPTPQVTDLSPAAPEAMQRVIGRCLAKDPTRRYQSIKEVAIEIDDLRQELKALPGPAASGRPSARTLSGASRADEGFWVAVLPFTHRGAHADLEALADGLAEDIVTGLLRFSYLRVVARSSTRRFTSEAVDVRTVGKELGARYVMEGSLRQAGATLRVAVQFVDATTGAHLWAETYDRTFSADGMFALQDNLVPRIVSTVADWYGVLPHSMSEAVRLKPLDQLTPYEALLRSFGYYERVVPDEHAAAQSALERAVKQAPAHAEIWAMLSMLYGEEYRFGFNAAPDPLGRSLQAARRAVAAAPSSHYAHLALAQALFFRKEFDAFRPAAERAVALNPMDGSTIEYVGHLLAFAGDWERGCELAEKARHLNPHHPAWYWALPFLDAYRKGDYVTAHPFILKADMPGQFFSRSLIAAVQGQLGEREAAEDSMREVLALKPDFPLIARVEFAKWYPPELVERLMDGLRKAGLERPGDSLLAERQPDQPASGAIRADAGFWVAVLPFKFSGASPDLQALAEGLSDDIVTGMSRFSYLRVIGRGSTLRYASQTEDLRAVGKELGARYVMEGSLRQAGSMLRVAVQLVDASTGAELWAETYDRQFRAEDVFALQDELTPRIVSTVADQYGALVHSMSESLRGRRADQYSAHEAVLRAFGYLERITQEEHKEVREILEAATSAASGHSDCQAMLALMYWHEYANGFNVGPDPLGRAHAAARQAVATGPTNHLAHYVLATVLFYQKDFQAFRSAAERALALNRMDASTTAFLAILIAYSGDWEYGLVETERAKQLNPHHAGWYHFAGFHYAYRRRDYRGALEIALKINMPGYFFTHTALAAVYGQLGELERARAALRKLDALVPDFGAIARNEYGKWFDAEMTEHLLDGLRKAGLKVSERAARH
jgi:TolB-like protein/tRNA A-37 threonylcarbamoyl transferase component Bud32/Tfp pilus assembly protein PilF